MISVVMASYLGDYPGAASDRPGKLRRAIDSFLMQNLGELIIVADGCQRTMEIVKEYKDCPTVRAVLIDKQPHFSGVVRQTGIKLAHFDWICYLDADDEFKPGHLQAIQDGISPHVDWVFYDDYVNDELRTNEVSYCRIGTSAIAHRRDSIATWPDGYGHDWGFIQQLGPNYKKIFGTGYIVHHIPGRVDT